MAEYKEVNIKNLDDKQVAYVSFKGNYMGNAEVFKNLFNKLFKWAAPKGLLNDTSFIACYHDDPQITPPDELVLDICMTINDNVEVSGEVKKKVLPGGKYAVMHAELMGPEEYGPAWMKVVEWMKENNYVVDSSRPSYELYLNNPEEHPEKHHILEVCMSVKAK